MDDKHEAHCGEDIVGSFWRWIVMLCVVVSGVTLSTYAYAQHDDSIRQHISWIQNCSPNPISMYVLKAGLIVYGTDLGAESSDVIRCLLIESGPDLDDQAVVIFPSPIDTVIDMESLNESPMPEALLRIGNKLLVVAGTESDKGVTEVQRVSGDTFVVTTKYMTHDRNFLLEGSGGKARYLINGHVTIERGKIIVSGMKSYFKGGGAFWVNALIDRDGNILDIVAPDKGDYAVCMSRDELSRKTDLDLSRVRRHRVCIER